MPLYDPCCGTGTLLIESAFIALNRAPGLKRTFACDDWGFMPKAECQAIRDEAIEKFEEGSKRPLQIAGSDIDPEAIELAVKDLRDVTPKMEGGVFLCNPPYGERIGDKRVTQAVAKQLYLLKQRSPGWSLCAITADTYFEKNAGRRADKKRRLYNGRLECEFMIFNP